MDLQISSVKCCWSLRRCHKLADRLLSEWSSMYTDRASWPANDVCDEAQCDQAPSENFRTPQQLATCEQQVLPSAAGMHTGLHNGIKTRVGISESVDITPTGACNMHQPRNLDLYPAYLYLHILCSLCMKAKVTAAVHDQHHQRFQYACPNFLYYYSILCSKWNRTWCTSRYYKACLPHVTVAS